ncbi:hypothetical protein RI367_002799 [Sorochytrium milnesiophthora]
MSSSTTASTDGSGGSGSYKPTEHGLVTVMHDVSLAEVVGATVDRPTKLSTEERVRQRQDNSSYTAKQSSTACPTFLADAQSKSLGVLFKERHGPQEVKHLIDYLYYATDYRQAEQCCTQFMTLVAAKANPSVSSTKEVVETGLRCAYKLRDYDMAKRYMALLKPTDANASYLLGTAHQHIPVPTAKRPALLPHLISSLKARPNDVLVWIAIRDLLYVSEDAQESSTPLFLRQLGGYAHQRALSIMYCAKVHDNEHARASWRRLVDSLNEFTRTHRAAGNGHCFDFIFGEDRPPMRIWSPPLAFLGGDHDDGGTQQPSPRPDVPVVVPVAPDAAGSLAGWSVPQLQWVYTEAVKGIMRVINPWLDRGSHTATAADDEEDDESGLKAM